MKFFAAVIVVFSFFSFASCINPFAPGLDEKPTTGVCPPLTDIDGVFCVFRNSYSFKDTTLYASVLSNNFNFIYRDYDNGVDVNWGRDDEMRTTSGLFSNAQQLALIWNTIIARNGSGTGLDTTILRAFTLTITFNPSDIIRVEGYANIKMRRPANAKPWKIVEWRDESNF